MNAIRCARTGTWAALVLLATLSVAALSAPRVALVIGNAADAHAPPLATPLSDAADIGAALGRLGFDVTRAENADYGGLRRALGRFSLAAPGSRDGGRVLRRARDRGGPEELPGTGGCAVGERPARRVRGDADRAGPAGGAGATGLRLVILDACRENPFVAKMKRAGGTRSIGRGLARVVHLAGENQNPPWKATHTRASVEMAFDHWMSFGLIPEYVAFYGPISAWTVADRIWTEDQMDGLKRYVERVETDVAERDREWWRR